MIENNTTDNNQLYGILQEIGGSVIIRNNTVSNEGYNPGAPNAAMFYSAGIMCNASRDVEINHNMVTGWINGIGAINANRGPGNVVQNLYVHDNVIHQVANTAAGLLIDSLYTASASRRQITVLKTTSIIRPRPAELTSSARQATSTPRTG